MNVRPAAVSGTFYPADTTELATLVQRLLENAACGENPGKAPRALVVPHAGLIYSGEVAAAAFRLLRDSGQDFRRVLLLGPNHRVPLRTMVVPTVGGFACPSGVMTLDAAALRAWVDNSWVEYNDEAHRLEHCLEVQLPFLLRLNPAWQLLPVIVGQVEPEAIAALVGVGLDSPDTLVVVSSDLSHYHSYEVAQGIDRATTKQIEQLDPALHSDQACGCVALNGLLRAAAIRGLGARCLDLRNSGDTAGSRDRVVGYGAYVIA
ncbi:AmmeMemoRadiSam system protein B [Marinobacterium sedimentorum]|uniref:AmmeMemoRadiSam system protein B n=1 Tax=Marinobacterium sedimentorum TaxID=2927804 RepID=UPI0020C63073|nr:AmmeMemoRadiSam system protein B [Marinobacterium sedimentorum]MCP8689229.1 AmmeMemoRadiSam system protein B [Marinobacterium sedimentorum]